MNYLLIGKPNVGKSSIFNVLIGKKTNIVHKDAGTTRDWHKDYIANTSSYIYDTPGILINDNSRALFTGSLNKKILDIVDCFLYVIDFNNINNDIDIQSINKLRIYNKNIFLIINKYDNHNKIPNINISKYGIKDVIFLSCSHRYGFHNLQKLILSKENNIVINRDLKTNYSIAIFGKPNVGKSTFLNTIIGYERAHTSNIAGTTSDLVSDTFAYKNNNFDIIDTAGIGKKANIKDSSIGHYSIKKSFENINKVDSAIIIIDSTEGVDRQDKRIISMILDKAKSLIIIFNKIDLIDDKIFFKKSVQEQVTGTLSQIKNIKFFFISAFNKPHSNKILDYLSLSMSNNNFKLSTGKLNSWLKNITNEKNHPLVNGKKINFKYIVQVRSKPITIKIFCNYSNKLKKNYKQYLINNFNNNFKILNQKTKFIFSSSLNPYI